MTTRTVVAHGPDPGRGGLPSQDTLPEKGSNGNATVTDPSSFACGHLLEKYAGTTTFTLRSLDGALLREVELKSGAYEWVEDYIYRDGQLLASQHRTEGHQHYHLDHLGTTRMLTNRCGERVKRYELFPYGDTISAPANDTETRRFTGHQRDLGSPTNTTDDLEYMHARYYGVKMGRLLSVDPGGGRARTPMQWNRYAYVSGNPMRRVDPDGAEEAEVAIPIWQRETIRDYYNQAEPGLGDALAEQHDRSMQTGRLVGLTALGVAAVAPEVPALVGAAFTYSVTPQGQQMCIEIVEALGPNPTLGAIRGEYIRRVAGLGRTAEAMLAGGASKEQVVRALSPARNELKAACRMAMPWLKARKLDLRNLMRYGNRLGPSLQSLIRKYRGNWDEIYNALFRTSEEYNRYAQ